MRILIDIGHPAHVHYFRNLAQLFISRGDEILFTCRDKEIVIDLLESYKLNYKCIGQPYKKISGKIFGLIQFNSRLLVISKKFHPDILLSAGSIYAAQTAYLIRKPHITIEDTFNFEQIRLYLPFTKAVLTSDYEHPLVSNKVVKYSGYQELAYLHPRRFTPDSSVLSELGVSGNEKIVIMRFVAWNASHDIGHKGISLRNKVTAVREFSKYAKVFISAESALPEELEGFRIKVPPHRIHDALAFSTLHFAESFTMPAECSVLGTPSVIIHNNTAPGLQEQQNKYGLCYKFNETEEGQNAAIKKGIELLNTPSIKKEWANRRDRMLSEKIDVTAFLEWFIENWPESFRKMKEEPDYQLRFK